jgi:hypothetical protein
MSWIESAQGWKPRCGVPRSAPSLRLGIQRSAPPLASPIADFDRVADAKVMTTPA